MKEKNEIRYLICDDTLDIGKEPLPTTKEEEEFDKLILEEIIKEYKK